MSEHFTDRLTAGIRRCGNAVLVGLDPRASELPDIFFSSDSERSDPAKIVAAYRTFCRGIIDVVAPLVSAIKPQAAFFEEAGPLGMIALAEIIKYARQQGLLVILDGKRNDIGSTATAYARAYLGALPHSRWGADALTVSPYLGDDSLRPFVDVSLERNAGIFVLVKTSNPGGGLFQDLVADNRPVFSHVAKHVEQLACETLGESGYGAVGAVVGATYPEQLEQLRQEMPHTWFLIPGFGAQGGTARDVAAGFDSNGLGALVNSSRAIIFAPKRPEYRDRFAAGQWQDAVAEATRDMIQQLAAAS